MSIGASDFQERFVLCQNTYIYKKNLAKYISVNNIGMDR